MTWISRSTNRHGILANWFDIGKHNPKTDFSETCVPGVEIVHRRSDSICAAPNCAGTVKNTKDAYIPLPSIARTHAGELGECEHEYILPQPPLPFRLKAFQVQPGFFFV